MVRGGEVSAVMEERDDDDDLRLAHAALERWAKWASTVFVGIGWPRANLIARVIELGITGAAQAGGLGVTEADEFCEFIDRAIRRLDETERQVVTETYLAPGRPGYVVARRCGLTHGYYRNVLTRCRRRVGDMLAGARVV